MKLSVKGKPRPAGRRPAPSASPAPKTRRDITINALDRLTKGLR
jgi:hypothetical protein